NRQSQRSLAPMTIREHSKQDCAERANEKSNAERRKRHQKRLEFGARWKEKLAYRGCKKSVDDEIEPLQRVADRRGSDGSPTLGLNGRHCCRGDGHRAPNRLPESDSGNNDRF